jgi:hypothetical protein
MLLYISIGIYLIAIVIIIFRTRQHDIDQFKLLKTAREKYIEEIDQKYIFDKDIYNKNLSNIPLYIINLPQSKVRKNFLEKQIQQFNINNFKFIDAIYGKNKKPSIGKNMFQIPMNTQKKIYFFNNDENANDGEIGCTLSHLNAVRQAYNDGLEHVIICEDDVDLYWIKIWGDTISSIISNAPKGWEYINLSKICIVDDSKNNYLKYSENNCWTTASQLWNRKGMKKILDKCYKDNKFILNKDWEKNTIVADYYIPHLINSYIYHINLFPTFNDEEGMKSTIHKSHGEHHIQESINNIKKLYNMFTTQNIPK